MVHSKKWLANNTLPNTNQTQYPIFPECCLLNFMLGLMFRLLSFVNIHVVYNKIDLQMEQKVLAEKLFKGKRETYQSSIRHPFVNSRLGEALLNNYYIYLWREAVVSVMKCPLAQPKITVI